MGASKSKEPSDCSSNICAEDLEMLHTTFKPFIMVKSDVIDQTRIEASFNQILPQTLSSNLCELLVISSKDGHADGRHTKSGKGKYSGPITLSGLMAFVNVFLDGNMAKYCDILTKLASSQRDVVTAEEIHQFVSDIIQSYLIVITNTNAYRSWEKGVTPMRPNKLALNLLHELFHKGKELKDCMNSDAIPDLCYSSTDIEHWLRCSPLATKLISLVFRAAFGLENGASFDKDNDSHKQLLPLCRGVSWEKTQSMLSLIDVLFLNQCLSNVLTNQWRYVFSTTQHGESFSELLGKILNKGPTIMLIKNNFGEVFGGYASESWKLGPQFKGDESCFLFTLHPRMGMFQSTGFNDHYMYLNINQKTLPNGLGMGGQLEYFGLWLPRDSFNGKCSTTCSTFQSPQLSASQEFIVENVEVWAVGVEPEIVKEGRSALDTVDPALKVMLEMTNRAPISDSIREADRKASALREAGEKAALVDKNPHANE